MKKLLLSAAAVAAVAVMAPALAQNAAPATAPVGTSQPKKAMKPMTRAAISERIQRQFARMDIDKDGVVTKAEAEAVADSRAKLIEEHAARRAQRHDPAAIFTRLDSNRDGRITRAEAEAARTATAARSGAKPATVHADRIGRLFDRGDTNRDGVISRAEFDAALALRDQRRAARGGTRGGHFSRMFALADANNDGRVTQQEATAATLRQFDAADTNRDGTLSAEEIRHARAHRATRR